MSISKSKTKTKSKSVKLTVFPYEFVVKDAYVNEHVVIHVWCMDRHSNPVFLRIEDFPACCYVELPIMINEQNYKWNKSRALKLYEYLCWRLGSNERNSKDHAPIGYDLTFRKKTYYYFGEGEWPMLLLKFRSLEAMKHCENMLKYPLNTGKRFGTLNCQVWETKIPIVRKLLTNQNMSFSQWFTVDAEVLDASDCISSVKAEYKINWKTMSPIPLEVSEKFHIYPRIFAYDIECYSDDKRMFPNHWHAKHVAYMISCIYQIYKDISSRKRYAIILGPCADIPKEKLDNTVIIHVSTEYELIQAFGELILELDPEIITGYNIFSFDYKYLDSRLTQRLKKWPMMGRIPDNETVMNSQEWASGAYGHNVIYDLKMDGRINIDLLPIIKRDYKLLKYTLDYVSGYFLKAHKHDITAPDMFWIYEELRDSQVYFEKISKSESGVDPKCKIVLLELNNRLEELLKPCLWQSKNEVFAIYENLEDLLSIYGKYQNGEEWSKIQEEIDLCFVEDDNKPLRDWFDVKSIFELLNEHQSFFEKYKLDIYAILRYTVSNVLMTFVLMYCIQDSELVLDLIEKLNVVLGLIQMSTVCGVTIVELFTRGQQLRCMSLLYDIAVKQGFVIDRVAKPGYTYTGGFVYPPKKGLHENVMCWDFSSLYPTIIMAYNIDHTTLVHPSIEHLIPDELCNVIVFEQEEEVEDDEGLDNNNNPDTDDIKDCGGKGSLEKPEKRTVIRKYRFKYLNADKTGKKGLIPQLEHKMVTERRQVRAKGRECKDEVMKIVYHQRQLALKVVCNSFYGFLGVRNGGKMPLMEAAMSITGKARESIQKVSSYIEDKYNGVVVYGDSVTGDTPILCRKILRDGSSRMIVVTISCLYNGQWDLNTNGKEYGTKVEGLEVWSDSGFTKIKHIMRHKTKKRIYRITTQTGIVKVTEDHSLLDEDKVEVSPNEISVGNRLLTHTLPVLPEKGTYIPDAWVWGLFYGDGSCDRYNHFSELKYSWVINNQNLDILNKAKSILTNIYPDNDFKIVNTMKSPGVYKLKAVGKVRKIVNQWRELFYDPVYAFKKVPDELWSASKESREAFYLGYCGADGDKDKHSNMFDNKGDIGSAGLFFLFSSLDYRVSCDTRKGKLSICRLTLTKKQQRKDPGLIKTIEDLGFIDDYVYDLETENHHFSAGIGEVVVHNTDSVMAKMGISDHMEAVEEGKRLEKELTNLFPPPMNMELEKVMRILCLKKKRYVASLVDEKTGKLKLDRKDLMFKGIELARRDRPKWLTDLQANVIDKIMHLKPFEEAFEMVLNAIEDLLNGKVNYRDLITVKGLNASYKSKTAQMAVFAESLKVLGKPAQPGSRLEFLVVRGEEGQLLGNRMRLPETYLERKGTSEEEEIDYMYYIDQLTNPIGQLLTVAYMEIIPKLSSIRFRPTKKHGFVGFDDPIKMVYRMIKYGKDCSHLIEAVKYQLYEKQKLVYPSSDYKKPKLKLLV